MHLQGFSMQKVFGHQSLRLSMYDVCTYFRGSQGIFSATVFQRAVAEFEPICNNWQTRPAGRYYAIDKAQSMHFQSAVHYIRGQILELPFSLQSTYFEALLNFSYKFPQFSRYPFVTIYLTELTAQTVGILTFIL